MFNVYDGGRPCNISGFPALRSSNWENNSFETFEEAEKYAIDWLGWEMEEAETKSFLTVNVPYDYSGYGDFIEIREEA